MTAKQAWAEKLKKWRRDKEEDYARAILSPPSRISLSRAIPYPGVVIVLGARGAGKTGLAHEIAHEFHRHKNLPAVVHLPKSVPAQIISQFKKMLPKWMRITNSSREWPAKSIIIYDEASQTAHARRTQSGEAVKLDNLIGISRQRQQLIIFIVHHSRKLDPNVIHDCDRVLWKMPTQAHAIWEREEMTDFTYRALDFFTGIRGEKARLKATLVMDFHHLNFSYLNNPLPPWWSEKLSCLFQDIKSI